jgi:hypothetical protein
MIPPTIFVAKIVHARADRHCVTVDRKLHIVLQVCRNSIRRLVVAQGRVAVVALCKITVSCNVLAQSLSIYHRRLRAERGTYICFERWVAAMYSVVVLHMVTHVVIGVGRIHRRSKRND